MIILDTSVVSEVMRSHCDSAVTLRFNRQDRSELHMTSIRLAELLFGMAITPVGRRKQGLIEALAWLRRSASSFVLPFEEAASLACSEMMAGTRNKGLAIS